MLEKPPIADEMIIVQLEAHYELDVALLAFLPIGNDARAWAFRVETSGGDFFLKLRRGALRRASLVVPHYLHSKGIHNVVAPIETAAGDLAVPLADYGLIMYPYVPGKSTWGMALTEAQWHAWGRIMRAIHELRLSTKLCGEIPREVFAEKWLSTIDAIEAVMAKGARRGEIATSVVALWHEHRHEIALARERYLALGAELEERSPQFVLCHADIHTANIIIPEDDRIQIVDWDESLLAPKERDLMFFIGDGHAPEEEAAFLDGYGHCDVDALGLAYYRYDWVLQELGDYGERVFLAPDVSDRDLEFALIQFDKLFAAGDVVERAHQAYARLGWAGVRSCSTA